MEQEARVRLSATQLRAIDGEMRGLTSSEIGKEVGVAGGTVRNWRSQNLAYRRELDRRLHELGETYQSQELRIAGKVLHVIEQALDEGDARVAIRIHRAYSGFGQRLAEENDPLVRSRLDAIAEATEGPYPAWAQQAQKANRTAHRLVALLESDEPLMGEIARLGWITLIALTTALDKSEGEGPRALCPTPGSWQRKHFRAARRYAEEEIEGVPAGPQVTGWSSVAADGVASVFFRMAQVSCIICTAFRGPDQSPPLPEPFAGRLEVVEAAAATVINFCQTGEDNGVIPENVLDSVPALLGSFVGQFIESISDDEVEAE